MCIFFLLTIFSHAIISMMFLLFVTCCLRQPPCVCGQRSLRLELVDDIDSMSFAVSLTASFYAIIHAYMNESMNKGPWSW